MRGGERGKRGGSWSGGWGWRLPRSMFTALDSEATYCFPANVPITIQNVGKFNLAGFIAP